MNKYNLIIDYSDITTGILVEPVTLQEVKDYLRLEGFIDVTEILATDFNDDNALILELITSSRNRIELYTGLSLVPKTFKVELTNLAGHITLPFGPILDITAVTDVSGTALNFSATHNLSKLKTPIQENLLVTYDCGYVTLPKGLKEAMLKEIAYRYENRGDIENNGLSQAAINLASPYKEVNTWLA